MHGRKYVSSLFNKKKKVKKITLLQIKFYGFLVGVLYIGSRNKKQPDSNLKKYVVLVIQFCFFLLGSNDYVECEIVDKAWFKLKLCSGVWLTYITIRYC